jgi:Uncharacterized protein conserved in bacteria (DUF2252)
VDVAIKTVGIGSVGTWCIYPHHGQRVVMGQRLMQPASDLFLGWMTGRAGRHLYFRQLRDAKIKPQIETFEAEKDHAALKAAVHKGTIVAQDQEGE